MPRVWAQRVHVQSAQAQQQHRHDGAQDRDAVDSARMRTPMRRSLLALLLLLYGVVMMAVTLAPLALPLARGASGSSLPPPPPPLSSSSGPSWTAEDKLAARETVREMFDHAYGNYLRHAPPPHDELKPLSRSWTDSLAELGNARSRQGEYRGVAMTLIDSLSTLAVMGHAAEFARAVDWVSDHVSFDQDVRVNVFEVNIRLVGGLLSAHLLASDEALGLHPNYDGRLLPLAKDLGDRLLPAFVNVRPYEDEDESGSSSSKGPPRSKVQLPYAWVNLRHGVESGETAEQCTAGIGTLLLEFGMLSHLTNRSVYYDVAERALFSLWNLRSRRTNLLGNSLSCLTGQWTNANAGIGAGVDSFFEYLLKSAVLFGNAKWLHMHGVAAGAVRKHLRWGDGWYVEADMHSGSHSYVQFNSLAAFYPGLQTLLGEVEEAAHSHLRHHALWARYDGLPERFLLPTSTLHSTERHYILRPELAESAYYLYRATRDPNYLRMGMGMVASLQRFARVPGGFAGIRDLETKEKEDRMHSFFLSETLKYLYLLFDEENFVHAADMTGRRGAATQHGSADDHSCPVEAAAAAAAGAAAAGGGKTAPAAGKRPPRLPNYVFTTEGHVFPVLAEMHTRFGDLSAPSARRPSGDDEAAATAAGEEAAEAGASFPSVLSPSLSKSKYSLFASPSSRMNSDTRAYLREWRVPSSSSGSSNGRHDASGGEGRVDFRRLAREAHCPAVPAHLRGDAATAGAGHARKTPPSHFLRLHAAFELRRRLAHHCPRDSAGAASGGDQHFSQGQFAVRVGEGTFSLAHLSSGEVLDIRNLGTPTVEITNVLPLGPRHASVGAAAAAGGPPPLPRPAPRLDDSQLLLRPVVLEHTGDAFAFKITSAPRVAGAGASAEEAYAHDGSEDGVSLAERRRFETQCSREWDAIGSFFSPAPSPLPLAEGGDTVGTNFSSSTLRFSSYATSSFLVAPVTIGQPSDGCAAPTVADSYRGRIVLLERGSCTFVDKVALAQQAGAVAVIVINDAEAASAAASASASTSAGSHGASIPSNPLPLLMMGSDGSGREILIPSLMVPRRYGEQLRACLGWHERMQDARRDALEHRAKAEAAAAAESGGAGAASATATVPFRRAPMLLELVKYLIPPTSLTPTVTVPSASGSAASASANLHPRVVGTVDRFFVTAMGGWTVDIEEKNGAFMLKVY